MCAWLVDEQYLRVNPFNGLPSASAAGAMIDATGRTVTHQVYTADTHRDYFVLLLVSPGITVPL